MAHITNKALYMLNADIAPTFNPGTGGGVANVIGSSGVFYFHTTGTTWVRYNLAALSGADGNPTPVVRTNSTAGIAPTSTEVPSPVDGDSANISLTNGILENWVRVLGAWVIAYTLESDKASNLSISPTTTNATVSNSNGTGFTLAGATASIAGLMTAADKGKLDFISITSSIDLNTLKSNQDKLVTLSGVAANSANLGNFTGSVIGNNLTVKQALQTLETALENIDDYIKSFSDSATINLNVDGAGNLTAEVKLSDTQDNLYEVKELDDGLSIQVKALSVFDSFALAQSSGLATGNAFVLSMDNIEGISSDGVTGPVFRKQ